MWPNRPASEHMDKGVCGHSATAPHGLIFHTASLRAQVSSFAKWRGAAFSLMLTARSCLASVQRTLSSFTTWIELEKALAPVLEGAPGPQPCRAATLCWGMRSHLQKKMGTARMLMSLLELELMGASSRIQATATPASMWCLDPPCCLVQGNFRWIFMALKHAPSAQRCGDQCGADHRGVRVRAYSFHHVLSTENTSGRNGKPEVVLFKPQREEGPAASTTPEAAFCFALGKIKFKIIFILWAELDP